MGLDCDKLSGWCLSGPLPPVEIVVGGDPDLALDAFRNVLSNRRGPERTDPKDDNAPDREAIDHIYSELIEAMVSLGVTLGLPAEAVQDVAHQTFLRLLRSGRHDVGRKYLLQAMRNAVKNWFRDRARGAAAQKLYDAAVQAAGHPDPRADWGAALSAERLDSSIEALPEPERTAVRLCTVVGWKTPRVAPLMGMTPEEVAKARDRARRFLVRELGG